MRLKHSHNEAISQPQNISSSNSPEVFWNVIILELAAELVQAVLAVVAAVAAHGVVDAALALVVPLVDAEDGVGERVVAEELSLLTLQHRSHS